MIILRFAQIINHLSIHLVLGFHTMGGDEAMDKFEICMGANLTCMNDLMNRMGNIDQASPD